MIQSLVTIIAPLALKDLDRVRAAIDQLGNPALDPLRTRLDDMPAGPNATGLHFASLNAFSGSNDRVHLVFEFSGDGEERQLIRDLATAVGDILDKEVFALATDRGERPIAEYWQAHSVRVGSGYFSVAGLPFSGTPEMTVHRIRHERDLFVHLQALLAPETGQWASALLALESVRRRIGTSPHWQWSLTPEPTATLAPERQPGLKLYFQIAWSFVAAYLWPGLIPVFATMGTVLVVQCVLRKVPFWTWATWAPALKWSGVAAVAATALLLGAVGLGYWFLRRREASDEPENRRTDPELVARIMERENRAAQNHLAALFVMKPGWLRKLTIRLGFRLIGELASRAFRPGFLGALGTIHFARWVTVPGTGDLLFLSNYGGSWESYLEDFITRAHNGLTGVWSNTIGFPRSRNLFQDGATDGARFKNWARRWQIPTGFWYSAYPDVTTSAVRRNAAVREGLALALTEDEARAWLSLFGSTPRPDSALEVNEIQSLTFGGLGFLRFGMSIAFRFGTDRQHAREWLADLLPQVSFGDGRKLRDKQSGAVTLGLTRSGLERLGLPDESVRTFPQPFLDGMTVEWRSRVLGDVGENAPTKWWWGGTGEPPIDGLLLLYAASVRDLAHLRRGLLEGLSKAGHSAQAIAYFEPQADRTDSVERKVASRREPFGFADGISQPVIRGSYKALRSVDPIHIVEAGEFILGYPDNRGSIAPTPTLAAVADPDGLLPVGQAPAPGFSQSLVNEPRDLGRNGTFLAVRQLEQDVAGFSDYCKSEEAALRSRFPTWDIPRDQNFIGAKLVGRWPDGSSLVRYPYAPASDIDEKSPSLSISGRPLARTAAGTAAVAPSTESVPPPMIVARRTVPPRPAAPHAADAEAAGPDAGKPGAAVPRTVEPVVVEPDNDFLFGAEDPQGLRCPYGAHIRRANPRESGDPGSTEQLSITNRHRILRIGRKYRPMRRQKPGLFFMCLNADIERQFEFVQQTWLQNESFHGLSAERDPLLGHRTAAEEFTLPTRSGPIRLKLPDFVHTRGGGYFFLPSRAVLQFLAK